MPCSAPPPSIPRRESSRLRRPITRRTTRTCQGPCFRLGNFTSTPANTTTIWTFHDGDNSHSWDFSIHPTLANTGPGGGTPDPTLAVKDGQWFSPDQGRATTQDVIQWSLSTPVNPQPGFVISDSLVASQNQFWDCPKTLVDTVIAGQQPVAAPAASYTVACDPTSLTVTFSAPPPDGARYYVLAYVNLGTPTGTASVAVFDNTAHFVGTALAPSTGATYAVDQSPHAVLVQSAYGGQGNGDGITLHKYYFPEGLPAGDYDAAPGKLIAPNTDLPVSMTITNTGSTTLTNLVVSDQVTSGPPLQNLMCNFGSFAGAGATATTAPNASFPPGQSFSCTGTLNLPAGSSSQDTAIVTAVGNAQVQSQNPFNAFAPSVSTTASGSASPLNAGSGATTLDTVSVGSANGSTGTYAWSLWFAAGRTCASMTAADWAAVAADPAAKRDSGSVPFSGDGQFPTGSTTVPTAAGCLGYQGTVTFADGQTVALGLGSAGETVDVSAPVPTNPTVTTQISPTTGALPGATISDTFSVSGLGAANPVTAHWSLKLFPGATSCGGLNWSDPSVVEVASGDQQIPGDVPAATPVTVSSTATTRPGCYTFVWSLPATGSTTAYTTPAGVSSESLVPTAAGASVSTQVSAASVTGGSGQVHDSVTVTGSNGVAGTYTATLYGPVTVPAGSTDCSSASWATAAVVDAHDISVAGDATYTSPSVAVSTTPGVWQCFSYGGDFGGGLSGHFAPGAASETVLVVPAIATMSTQASPATGSPGAAASDVVTVGGLGSGVSAKLDWELRFAAAVNGACTGVDWASASKVDSATGVSVHDGANTITPTVTLNNAGCYSFKDVLHAAGGDVTSDFGVPAETMQIAANLPVVATQASGGALGAKISDTFSVSGLGAANPVTAHWSLKLFPGATSCGGLNWSDPSVVEVASGDQQIPGDVPAATPVTVSSTATTRPGCYTFVWSLPATGSTTAYTTPAGVSSESLVPTAAGASVSTQVSAASVTGGSGQVHDSVTVTGTNGVAGFWNWKLYGPVDVPAGTTACAAVTAAQFSVAGVAGSGTIPIDKGDNNGQPYATTNAPVSTAPGHWSCFGYAGDLSGGLSGHVDPGAADEAALVTPVPATISTQAAPATGKPGVQLIDTVTVTNLGTGITAKLDWELWHAADINGSCTGVHWTTGTKVDSATGVSVHDGQNTITPTVKADDAGCYSFKDVLHAATGDVVSNLGIVSETSYIAANVPTVATTASLTKGQPGDTIHDGVSLSGAGGATLPATATLYRLDLPSSGECDAANPLLDWTKAMTVHADAVKLVDGQSVTTPDVTITVPGCYSYGTDVPKTGSTAGASLPAGNVSETAKVTPLDPTVSTKATPVKATVGDNVHDDVIVGNTRGADITVQWRLLGPVKPVGGSCETADYTKAAAVASGEITTHGDGTVSTRDVSVNAAGCFTYVETLVSTATTTAVTTAPAATDETILVSAPIPPADPENSTLAFTGTADLPVLLGIVALLLGTGALLFVAGRRRREAD